MSAEQPLPLAAAVYLSKDWQSAVFYWNSSQASSQHRKKALPVPAARVHLKQTCRRTTVHAVIESGAEGFRICHGVFASEAAAIRFLQQQGLPMPGDCCRVSEPHTSVVRCDNAMNAKECQSGQRKRKKRTPVFLSQRDLDRRYASHYTTENANWYFQEVQLADGRKVRASEHYPWPKK